MVADGAPGAPGRLYGAAGAGRRGGSALAGWQIVEGLLQQEASDRLDVATKTFNSIYQQRVSDAEIVTRQLSDRTFLAQRILQRNSEQLTALIEPIHTLRPFYSIAVADRDGNVLAKIVPPNRMDPGPNLLDAPGVAAALEADAVIPVLVRRQDCQMVVAVSVPVKSPTGVIVGLMHIRFPLDDELARQVKYDTNLDLAFYCGDLLVASTLPGQSALLGTRADPVVLQHVLEDGAEWEQNVRAGELQLPRPLRPPAGQRGRARWRCTPCTSRCRRSRTRAAPSCASTCP